MYQKIINNAMKLRADGVTETLVVAVICKFKHWTDTAVVRIPVEDRLKFDELGIKLVQAGVDFRPQDFRGRTLLGCLHDGYILFSHEPHHTIDNCLVTTMTRLGLASVKDLYYRVPT